MLAGRIRGASLGAALVAGLLLSATPAQARTVAPRGPVLNVYQPAAGHVTLEAVAFTVTGKARAALPARLPVRFPGAKSLKPSVRVLYAIRRITRRTSTTFAIALLVVHRANRVAARAASRPAAPRAVLSGTPDKGEGALAEAFLLFLTGHNHGYDDDNFCPTCGSLVEKSTNYKGTKFITCSHCHLGAVVNADMATPKQEKPLADLMKLDFTEDGDPNAVFGDRGVNADPKLETGHYDDGHSFGWKTGKVPERDVWKNLTDALIADNGLADTIAQLEAELATDINGDGKVGSTGSNTNTTVGQPIITGGGP